ncbi:hypothetical protein [Coralloluteibacterium stylophorae]|uniref:Uncharacterized protein n=1 Tax=Coralloluteibacterium stylophorae TaxID=1776034 RepID=A0A8J7VVM1_9GAMM|nr:hypothetical protein [Coralloluteibacterium stylophorae]MBS7458642.1 hypothetical protein [Coralloluteibacterium stylophorae]
MREFWPPMLAYCLIVLFAFPWAGEPALPLAARLALALLPVVPMILVLRACARMILRSDELEQRLALQALAAATVLVGSVSFAIGFVDSARILEVPGSSLLLVLPATIGTWGLSRWWLGRRLRT